MKEKENKKPWWMVRNSNGKPDAALTFLLASLLLCGLLVVMGAISTVNVGQHSISFRSFDMGFASTIVIPLMGLYFGRRWTDTQRGLYDQQKIWAEVEKEKAKTKGETKEVLLSAVNPEKKEEKEQPKEAEDLEE